MQELIFKVIRMLTQVGCGWRERG